MKGKKFLMLSVLFLIVLTISGLAIDASNLGQNQKSTPVAQKGQASVITIIGGVDIFESCQNGNIPIGKFCWGEDNYLYYKEKEGFFMNTWRNGFFLPDGKPEFLSGTFDERGDPSGNYGDSRKGDSREKLKEIQSALKKGELIAPTNIYDSCRDGNIPIDSFCWGENNRLYYKVREEALGIVWKNTRLRDDGTPEPFGKEWVTGGGDFKSETALGGTGVTKSEYEEKKKSQTASSVTRGPATSGSPGSAATSVKKIIHIGDSHTAGAYGVKLHGLFHLQGHSIESYGCVGASANNYISVPKKCLYKNAKGKTIGSYEKRPGNSKDYNSPNIADLLKQSPDVIIISLGGNHFDKDGKLQSVSSIDSLTKAVAGKTCFFIGSPQGKNKPTSELAKFYDTIQTNGCQLIDSRPFTEWDFCDVAGKPACEDPKHLHNNGAEGRSKAESWAQEVFNIISPKISSTGVSAITSGSSTSYPYCQNAQTCREIDEVWSVIAPLAGIVLPTSSGVSSGTVTTGSYPAGTYADKDFRIANTKSYGGKKIEMLASPGEQLPDPYLRAFMRSLTVREGTSSPRQGRCQDTYRVIFGFDCIDVRGIKPDQWIHPGQVKPIGSGLKTDSGRFQIKWDTWQEWSRQFGVDKGDFSPLNQDKVVYGYLNYKNVGSKLQNDDLRGAVESMKGRWVSLKEVDKKQNLFNEFKSWYDALLVEEKAGGTKYPSVQSGGSACFPLQQASPRISYNWGHIRGENDRCHAGIDIYTKYNGRENSGNVVSISEGEVMAIFPFTECSGGSAQAILIYHPNYNYLGKKGITVNYGEIDTGSSKVSVGDIVKMGQVLGKATVCSMLHLEVYSGKVRSSQQWLPLATLSTNQDCKLEHLDKKGNLMDPTSLVEALDGKYCSSTLSS